MVIFSMLSSTTCRGMFAPQPLNPLQMLSEPTRRPSFPKSKAFSIPLVGASISPRMMGDRTMPIDAKNGQLPYDHENQRLYGVERRGLLR